MVRSQLIQIDRQGLMIVLERFLVIAHFLVVQPEVVVRIGYFPMLIAEAFQSHFQGQAAIGQGLPVVLFHSVTVADIVVETGRERVPIAQFFAADSQRIVEEHQCLVEITLLVVVESEIIIGIGHVGMPGPLQSNGAFEHHSQQFFGAAVVAFVLIAHPHVVVEGGKIRTIGFELFLPDLAGLLIVVERPVVVAEIVIAGSEVEIAFTDRRIVGPQPFFADRKRPFIVVERAVELIEPIVANGHIVVEIGHFQRSASRLLQPGLQRPAVVFQRLLALAGHVMVNTQTIVTLEQGGMIEGKFGFAGGHGQMKVGMAGIVITQLPEIATDLPIGLHFLLSRSGEQVDIERPLLQFDRFDKLPVGCQFVGLPAQLAGHEGIGRLRVHPAGEE